MGFVCEHEFEDKDPDCPIYSLIEYDLYARLNLAIRKNHTTGLFEIFKLHEPTKSIENKTIIFKGTLEEVVRMANELEGAENTKIECHRPCCRKIPVFYTHDTAKLIMR